MELLILFWLALSFCPVALFSAAAACCCGGVVCNKCQGDRSAAEYAILMPDDLTSDVGCGGCVNTTGTFILPAFFNPFPTCSWLGQGPLIGGCDPFIHFSIGLAVYSPTDPHWNGGASPGTWRVVVRLDPGGFQLVWQKDYGSTKPDCINFNSEEIPIVYAGTSSTRCKSTTNKSVFLTAVPA